MQNNKKKTCQSLHPLQHARNNVLLLFQDLCRQSSPNQMLIYKPLNSRVKEARRAAHSGEGPPVLYLNAGDTYTGTAWFTIYKWKIAAEFVNALQPDAVVSTQKNHTKPFFVRTFSSLSVLPRFRPSVVSSLASRCRNFCT